MASVRAVSVATSLGGGVASLRRGFTINGDGGDAAADGVVVGAGRATGGGGWMTEQAVSAAQQATARKVANAGRGEALVGRTPTDGSGGWLITP